MATKTKKPKSKAYIVPRRTALRDKSRNGPHPHYFSDGLPDIEPGLGWSPGFEQAYYNPVQILPGRKAAAK